VVSVAFYKLGALAIAGPDYPCLPCVQDTYDQSGLEVDFCRYLAFTMPACSRHQAKVRRIA
jgi:hypothetical protein